MSVGSWAAHLADCVEQSATQSRFADRIRLRRSCPHRSAARKNRFTRFFRANLIFDARVIGLLRRLARLAQRADALLGQQRTSFRNTSAVTIASPSAVCRPSTAHAEALGDRLEPCEAWFGMQPPPTAAACRAPAGRSTTPVAASLAAGSACRRRRCAPTSTVSCAKAWNAGRTSAIVGWPASISGRMPWIGDRGRGDRAPRIDQLLEALLAQQLAVDDAHRADLDDLVAAGRVEPGGLGVEHGVGQLGQRPLVELARSAPSVWNRSKS